MFSDGPGPTVDNGASNPQIAFILGGPCSGKGTQCARLAEDLKLAHISVGELLREQKDHEPPEAKELIERAMVKGKLLPASVIMPVLRKEIERRVAIGDTKILLDGFPRNFAQAIAFMEEFGECSLALFFKCSKWTLMERILRRAEALGRTDDNISTFDERMFAFFNETVPLVPYFQRIIKDRFIEIDAEVPLEEGYEPIKEILVRVCILVVDVGSACVDSLRYWFFKSGLKQGRGDNTLGASR